ncbi:hypothetical protein [Nocardia beijingensis]|uniref:hypothetical protein n=1 Tax=Nocardia beijingensis TaxID=95162 RepID=UPI000AD6AEF5|nr:hypothetical protein [Nocardia beijingensis]
MASIRLKQLLRERHWQKYATFCREYDRVASGVDPQLIGTAPSRGQLHRWLAGELKGLPYPDHCRVLEAMFPGWTAEALFEAITDGPVASGQDHAGVAHLVRAVEEAFSAPDAHRATWNTPIARNGRQATGLDGALGGGSDIPDTMQLVAKKLVALARVLRIDAQETARLASLAGQVVELEMHVSIDIRSDGLSTVCYRHELFNMSEHPVTRIAREVWFEHTPNGIQITPSTTGSRKVIIQRIHDTPGLSKFACQISPPIRPGETGTIAYECAGGQFVSDHYWRQGLPRYTRHVTITLRHNAVGRLLSYSATEEQVNGSEQTVSEDLIWDNDGDDVLVTLTRDYLRPGQSATVRWDVEHIERKRTKEIPNVN